MNYNQDLYKLYSQKWEGLRIAVESLPIDSRPTHPLLIRLPDENAYHTADVKMMIVGKETNDWEGPFGKHSMDSLLDFYAAFLPANGKSKRSPFWQYIKKWAEQIRTYTPNETVSIVWNNIHKLGRAGEIGTPCKSTQEIAKQHFNILEEEVKILKPDIVIFFTGPDYDNAISAQLPGIELEEITAGKRKQIAHCVHPSLPYLSYRTYHPGGLNRFKPVEGTFHRETPIQVILEGVKEKVSAAKG